jgi:hypothetical protein
VKRAALWLVALLAGCTLAGEEKMIDQRRLDELVLQPADVAVGLRPLYVPNPEGRPVLTVRYRRAHASPALESTVRVLESGDAADDWLEAARQALEQKREWAPIDEPGLGDESFAATVVRADARSYQVFWREANAAASLKAQGLEGTIPLEDVLALARKQEHRIEQAVR